MVVPTPSDYSTDVNAVDALSVIRSLTYAVHVEGSAYDVDTATPIEVDDACFNIKIVAELKRMPPSAAVTAQLHVYAVALRVLPLNVDLVMRVEGYDGNDLALDCSAHIANHEGESDYGYAHGHGHVDEWNVFMKTDGLHTAVATYSGDALHRIDFVASARTVESAISSSCPHYLPRLALPPPALTSDAELVFA